jgi:hypothetical protein
MLEFSLLSNEISYYSSKEREGEGEGGGIIQ